jgi:hypothetical protein
MLYKPEVTEISPSEIKELKVDETEPFKFKLENSLIADWITYHSTLSDAFVDYHHATGITALSIIINRKACFELKQVTVFPNIWAFIIGQSTIGRKSTIFSQMHDFDYIYKRPYRSDLPKQFSPEAFIEILGEYPSSYYINDECADLLKGINKKSYMADLRDTLCQIYDNTSFSRKLRTKRNKEEKTEFNIKDPYMPALFATVPSNIERFTEYDDLSSGWMIRFLYYAPKYSKKFMALTKRNENDYVQKTKISKKLIELNEFFEKITSPIEFYFEKDAEKYFEEWNENTDTRIAGMTDDIIQSATGRLEIYAFKLAMIYEIADNNFVEKFKLVNDHTGEFDFGLKNVYPVSLRTIKEACEEIDNYFIPMIERVKTLVESADNKNYQQKIINLLKRNGGILSKSKLYKLSRISRKDMNDALDVLSMDSEEIEYREEKGKTKSITYVQLKACSA